MGRARPIPLPGLLALIALFACDSRTSYEVGQGTPDGTCDLAREFGLCERWVEVSRIDATTYDDRGHLIDGWSYAPREPGDEGSQAPWIWAHALTPGLRFHIAEPAPRTLRFAAKGFLDEPTVAHVELNGEPVQDLTVTRRATDFEVRLPAAAQRSGPNRVTFAFEHGGHPNLMGKGNDRRLLTGCFRTFELHVEDAGVARRLRQARALAPEGLRTAHDARAIEQVSGTLLRYPMRADEGATFRAEVGLVDRAPGAPDAARFTVTAIRDGEAPQLVLDRAVSWSDRGRLEPVEARLDVPAGSVLALELRVEPAGGEGPLLGVWGRPRVTRDRPAAAAAVPGAGQARFPRAPIVVVLLDAFNPSYMSAYGGRPDLTPNLDRIASEGVLFQHAYSQATYTLSSIGTTLTSMPTWKHGVWNRQTSLLDRVPTWPEHFAANGYRTAGIICSPNGSSSFGYGRGFEDYVEAYDVEREQEGVVLAEETLPLLEAALESPPGDDRPLFLWMHVIEPHEPYDNSPPPWHERLDPDYTGDLTGSTEVLSGIRDRTIVPTLRDVQHLEAQYQEGLGYVDEVLGRARALLERAGILDHGILAVVSDHGEAFLRLEGKREVDISHGSTVDEEMAHIPLLVRLPGGARPGRRVSRLVAGYDLLPTMAELAGVPPLPGSEGTSFAPVLLDEAGGYRDFVVSHSYSLSARRFMPEFALWGAGFKYVHASGGGEELYELTDDLLEENERNLSQALPVRTSWMRMQLQREIGFDPDTGEVLAAVEASELDPEVMDQLRALGYVR